MTNRDCNTGQAPGEGAGWRAFGRRRRIRRRAREMLKHARHVRHMREDVADAGLLRQQSEAETSLRRALRQREFGALEGATRQLMDATGRLVPPRRFPGVRDNLEVLAVAVAVAMGFRTYFVQPFKIPTGSMQPTLYGIHYRTEDHPTLADRFPLKLVKWLIWGEWYYEVRAAASGVAGPAGLVRTADSRPVWRVPIGGVHHDIPPDWRVRFEPNQYVVKGQLLAAGIRVTGDHVFVNKVLWNWVPPRRGQVAVFRTDAIEHPQIRKKQHYIKRLVGLPGESLGVRPPHLVVDGKPLREPESIRRIIEDRAGGGYQYAASDAQSPALLSGPGDRVELGDTEYFVCGDNTGNSMDGRYWGALPRENLSGPAFLVYWPVSARWGAIR